MAKTLTVYTLYGDEEALREVMKRCIADSVSFHYTGEFLYSDTDWAPFLRDCCPELIGRVRACVERWSDSFLGFEGEEDWMDARVLRVRKIMQDLATELEALDPAYCGGEDWDPEEGYLFTADSISPLRERLVTQHRQLSGSEPSIPRQKDLSGCVAASRMSHQTEWVLKMKMPGEDKHVMMCISFCDGEIPEPTNPYNEKPTVHLDI